MTFTQSQKDLLFGSLLGDGNLQTFSQGRTWRYRALQKADHKDYLFHKYGVFENLCAPGTPPVEGEVFDERTGKTSKRWFFNTLTHESLRYYANMFYKYDQKQQKWIKDVPSQNNLMDNLTPQALAYLYMDDGALKWLGHSNAMRICTESFSIEGVQRLRNALVDLYQIQTTTSNKYVASVDETRHRLLIPEKASSHFREIIKPYLIDCMKYKVSDGNKGHL
jgi:hypothetical protein